MEQKYPLRAAMKNQSIDFKQLIAVIGKSRPTVSGYVDQYEMTGTVNNAVAQAEFDRIMAEERSRTLAMNSTDAELERIREQVEASNERYEAASREKARILAELMHAHPEVELNATRSKDEDGNEFLELEPEYVERLMDALTEDEKIRYCLAAAESTQAILESCSYTLSERVLTMEKLWDSTAAGTPRVIKETVKAMIALEEDCSIERDIETTTFCLSDGRSADIYADPDLQLMGDYNIYAEISVICPGKIKQIFRVPMADDPGCEGYRGHVDGLYPGYKYLYAIRVEGSMAEDEEINPKNWKRIDHFRTREHPLK